MIDVSPMKAEDLLWVIENGVKEVGLRAEPTEDMRKLAEEREQSGRCFTGRVDGEIIGCAGIDILWEGVGEAWFVASPKVNENKRDSYACILKGLKRLIKENNLRRVQGYGRVNFPESHILFKHLGFEVEGKMRKYTHDGVDCIMYGRVE